MTAIGGNANVDEWLALLMERSLPMPTSNGAVVAGSSLLHELVRLTLPQQLAKWVVCDNIAAVQCKRVSQGGL